MSAVLTGEFFWGVIIGLILSIIGGYALAIFQTNSQSKAQKLIFRDFSVDTVKNVKQIIDEMDDIRSRTGAIHLDFLVLMEVEIGVFGRNREHLTRLPEKPRERLRKLLNSIAIKRAEAVSHLQISIGMLNLLTNCLHGGKDHSLKEFAIQLMLRWQGRIRPLIKS